MSPSRRPPQQRASARRREPWLLPSLAVFVALPLVILAVVTFTRWRDDRPPSLRRDGSAEVAAVGAAEALAFGEPAASYDITYRVERYDETKITESEDRLQVRRPFESRITGLTQGRVVSERASRFGTLAISTGVGNRGFVAPPAPASGDLRFDVTMPEAVEEGIAVRREQREVLGRRCQVYRVGGPVQAGELVPVGTNDGEHADACVDAAGLLLEEVWQQEGRPLQRRIAVEVRVPSTAEEARFTLAGEEQVTFDAGNGFIRIVDAASGFEGTTYRLPESALTGYRYIGRFAVQPPRLSPFGNNPLEIDRPREQISQVDVWERGADLLVLTQVIAADIAAVPSDAEVAERVELGPVLGQGLAVLDLRLNDVRVELEGGYFVRLAGTLPRAELVRLARQVVEEETTGIVLLDDDPIPVEPVEPVED